MAINRKFMMILAVLMLGAVFLTGCGEGEETGLDGGPGITDPSGVGGEEGTGPGGSAGGEEADPDGEDEGQEEEAATLSGILKAVDDAAGTVTIESKTDGELVLEVNDEIKVFKGKAQATFEDLADNIGSEVIVEYDDRTKVATVIGILE
jgi:hypothetical protein